MLQVLRSRRAVSYRPRDSIRRSASRSSGAVTLAIGLITECHKGKFEQPTCLRKRRSGPPFPLHFAGQFFGDQSKRHFPRSLLDVALHSWINAVCEMLLGDFAPRYARRRVKLLDRCRRTKASACRRTDTPGATTLRHAVGLKDASLRRRKACALCALTFALRIPESLSGIIFCIDVLVSAARKKPDTNKNTNKTLG